jgi:hypothetical protein
MAEAPKIVFTKIEFPSDELTIQTLRRLSPDYFDAEPEACGKLFSQSDVNNPMIEVARLLDAERMVAEVAYLKAVGIQCSAVYLTDGQRCAEDAAELYAHFGIAKGQHHAEQLICNIQSQAADQAREHTGRVQPPSGPRRV